MKIEHINHSSVLLEGDNGEFVLTDPWFISPAFGGWTQNPSPPLDLIKKILSIPKSKLTVVISHGHDDHLDEFVISHHFKECNIVIPKFSTPGLEKRIQNLIGKAPITITEEEIVIGGHTFSALINEDFTHYDAIILISDGNKLCIHANDNWATYPPELVEKLKRRTVNFIPENTFFLSQFGIADCFPINYPNFSDGDCDKMIDSRIDLYELAFNANILSLGITHAYSYANQSTYEFPGFRHSEKISYKKYSKHIADHNLPITQLEPGMIINDTALLPLDKLTLFNHMLAIYQAKARSYLKDYDSLEFKVYSEDLKNSSKVIYSTSINTWQRILIGDLTIESISIGGMGMIFKENSNNIRDIHLKLSKFAYIAQSQIKKLGLEFYDM